MAPVLLIDAIVRQTTVLIAALATASGQRAQLAHIANQVFVDLARELREHGLGTKVIADMFGMALRTYQVRIARLSESRTDQGGSLWEAVLAYFSHAMKAETARLEPEQLLKNPWIIVSTLLTGALTIGLLLSSTNYAKAAHLLGPLKW